LDGVAGQGLQDLVGGAEQRATLLEIHVLDGELVVSGGELAGDSARGQCLAGAGRAIDRDGRGQIPRVEAVQQRGESALLIVPSDDLLGILGGIKRALVRENPVFRSGGREEVVVVGYGFSGTTGVYVFDCVGCAVVVASPTSACRVLTGRESQSSLLEGFDVLALCLRLVVAITNYERRDTSGRTIITV